MSAAQAAEAAIAYVQAGEVGDPPAELADLSHTDLRHVLDGARRYPRRPEGVDLPVAGSDADRILDAMVTRYATELGAGG